MLLWLSIVSAHAAQTVHEGLWDYHYTDTTGHTYTTSQAAVLLNPPQEEDQARAYFERISSLQDDASTVQASQIYIWFIFDHELSQFVQLPPRQPTFSQWWAAVQPLVKHQKPLTNQHIQTWLAKKQRLSPCASVALQLVLLVDTTRLDTTRLDTTRLDACDMRCINMASSVDTVSVDTETADIQQALSRVMRFAPRVFAAGELRAQVANLNVSAQEMTLDMQVSSDRVAFRAKLYFRQSEGEQWSLVKVWPSVGVLTDLQQAHPLKQRTIQASWLQRFEQLWVQYNTHNQQEGAYGHEGVVQRLRSLGWHGPAIASFNRTAFGTVQTQVTFDQGHAVVGDQWLEAPRDDITSLHTRYSKQANALASQPLGISPWHSTFSSGVSTLFMPSVIDSGYVKAVMTAQGIAKGSWHAQGTWYSALAVQLLKHNPRVVSIASDKHSLSWHALNLEQRLGGSLRSIDLPTQNIGSKVFSQAQFMDIDGDGSDDRMYFVSFGGALFEHDMATRTTTRIQANPYPKTRHTTAIALTRISDAYMALMYALNGSSEGSPKSSQAPASYLAVLVFNPQNIKPHTPTYTLENASDWQALWHSTQQRLFILPLQQGMQMVDTPIVHAGNVYLPLRQQTHCASDQDVARNIDSPERSSTFYYVVHKDTSTASSSKDSSSAKSGSSVFQQQDNTSMAAGDALQVKTVPVTFEGWLNVQTAHVQRYSSLTFRRTIHKDQWHAHQVSK